MKEWKRLESFTVRQRPQSRSVFQKKQENIERSLRRNRVGGGFEIQYLPTALMQQRSETEKSRDGEERRKWKRWDWPMRRGRERARDMYKESGNTNEPRRREEPWTEGIFVWAFSGKSPWAAILNGIKNYPNGINK